jgi:glycosyltransferase involved in cell wall biosynthesis
LQEKKFFIDFVVDYFAMDKHNNQLVSVIIPTWNRADCVVNAIESALAQTYRNIEVLVCDDGSNDHTKEIVSALPDRRIRWIPGEHSECPAIPKNRGIRHSKGEWLAFLDSDDTWRPRKLELQFEAISRYNTTAACTNAWRIQKKGHNSETFIFWNRPRVQFNDILAGNIIINSSVLLQKKLIARVSGFPENKELIAIEDYALWLRILTITDFAFVRQCLVNYTDIPQNSVRRSPLAIFYPHAKVMRNFDNWARNSTIQVQYLQQAHFWYIYSLKNFPALLNNAFRKVRRAYF